MFFCLFFLVAILSHSEYKFWKTDLHFFHIQVHFKWMLSKTQIRRWTIRNIYSEGCKRYNDNQNYRTLFSTNALEREEVKKKNSVIRMHIYGFGPFLSPDVYSTEITFTHNHNLFNIHIYGLEVYFIYT